MIKINLLRRHPAKTRLTIAHRAVSIQGILMLAALVILAGGMAAWWSALGRELDTLKQARDRLQEENLRLAALRAEIEEYERLKKLRASRIEVIERLKDAQTGPVLLLNQLIRSIPDNGPLWLTLVDQKGEKIRITGYSQRGEAVPEFMSSLIASGIFAGVDLESLENERDLAKFALVCSAAKKIPRE